MSHVDYKTETIEKISRIIRNTSCDCLLIRGNRFKDIGYTTTLKSLKGIPMPRFSHEYNLDLRY